MKPLILIIDDSDLILQMLDMICQQSGYRTVKCTEFAQVPDAIAPEAPAVILSDLNLPDLGAQDPVSALRAIDALAQTPIILVSGMDPAQLQQKAADLGADASISKDAGMPAMLSELPELVGQLLK